MSAVRLKNLIDKLEISNYSLFGGDKSKIDTYISSNLLLICDYVNTVIKQQIMFPVWAEYGDADSQKNAIHQNKAAYGYATIGALKLNELSNSMNSDAIFSSNSFERRDEFGDCAQQLFIYDK